MPNTTEEANRENISEMNQIPEETIKEILFLLPVKSLLKFRCVSRSWISFIDSPYCVKTHLSKSTPKIILNTNDGLFALDINPKNPKPKADASVLKQCYPDSDTFIKGSCNGVILTHHNSSIPPMLLPLKERCNLAFQNPYTKTFHKIPFVDQKWPGPKNMYCIPEKFVFAFWYDDLTDDYKFFRNCQFFGCMEEHPFFSQVNIYSSKMQTYKQIAPFPYYMRYSRDESVFVGGALHWEVSTAEWDKSQWIGSFDVVTEEYRLVEQPGYSSGDFKLALHVLGGCLSVVCSYTPLEHKEVWVMKEYGNVDSWSKILTISGVDIGVESFGYLKPLLYSGCGKKVLIERDCNTLLWYDLEKNSAEFVELDRDKVPGQFQAFVHLESLVKLSCRVDEKSAAQDNDEKPNKMNKKKRDEFLSKGFKLKFF